MNGLLSNPVVQLAAAATAVGFIAWALRRPRTPHKPVPGLPVDGEELADLDLVNWLLIAAAEDENPGPRSHPSQRRGRR